MSSALAIARIDQAGARYDIRGETASFGVSNIHEIDGQSSFDLASVTKVLCTTTILMRAVESGAIDLTNTISRFLPEFIAAKKDLTIEDLLRHESGFEEWRPFYISCKNSQSAIDLIAELPLKYPIRKEFHYSDLNFITLGEVIKKIYSAPLNAIFQAEVARPLALKNTQFAAPADPENVVATSIGDSIEYRMVSTKTPYEVPENVADFHGWRNEVLSGEINDGNAFHLFKGVSGHAGLFSTLEDLTTYINSLIEGFVTPATLQLFGTARNAAQQGIGFRRFPLNNGNFAIGHFGFTGTGLAILPSEKKGWVYLSNRLHTKENYQPMAEIWCNEFKEFSSLG